MAQPKGLNPTASPAAFFGAELRRYREIAGLTQDQLGKRMGYTGAQVGQVETTARQPTREFAERCDAALETGGFFGRYWPLTTVLPARLLEFADLESRAQIINVFEPSVIPGLFQTEEYMRAQFHSYAPDDPERLTAFRLGRQEIFTRPRPPQVVAVIDEAALHRLVGGVDVMRRQLNRLAEVASGGIVTLQVLPFSAGAHAGSDGSLMTFAFGNGSRLAYLETASRGFVITDPLEVMEHCARFDMIRAGALSPEGTSELIHTVSDRLGT